MRYNFLSDVQQYYVGAPHQKEALDYLEAQTGVDIMKISSPELIELQAGLSDATLDRFVDLWRNEPPEIKLDQLPYNTQLDNPIKPHYTCNSSAHYMMARSVVPGLPVSDSQYVKDVMNGKFGYGYTSNPSIYWDVHTVGLKSLGVETQYRNTSFGSAIAQVKKGVLTPVNIAHRGHITAPTGGHVVCLAGVSDDGQRLYIHDPYGELDYINGTSDLTATGKYWVTKKNFLKRWQGIWTEFIGLV